MDSFNKPYVMKNLFYIFCFLIILSCAEDDNLIDQIAVRGGFAEFIETPDTRINILRLDEVNINATIIDPNNNIENYTLVAVHQSDTINNFFEASSFPTELNLTIDDIITPFGMTKDDININTEFKFYAIIVTPTGVFSGLSPNFVENNVNIGGQTVNRLKETNMNDAVEFEVIFFQPPPKAIRQTSFEEPPALATLDNRYQKPGPPDLSEPLPNNPGGPILNYVSQGTSPEDELGFTSEFINNGVGDGFVEEHIGVNDNLAHFDFHKDGTQSFKIEDVDGIFKMTFETVPVPDDIQQSGVQISVFFRDSGWEFADSFHAYANVVTSNGSSSTIDIAPLIRGDDIDEVAGEWITFDTGFIPGITSYEVIIEAESSNFQEDLYWDLLVIYQPDEG